MTEHYTDKGHLLIRNSDIKDGYFEFGENPIYLDEEFSEQNKSRMHQLGDVITVHTGDIGTSAVIGENEVNSIGFATIVTRPNQEILDSNYFATYLNTDTHKQWAISMATGDGRSNYNLKDYTKLVVPIPEIEEQKKIATCIVNLNSLITLHHRKFYLFIEKDIFAWEQRKLGEYVSITSGEAPSKFEEGTELYVKVDDLNYNDKYVVDTQNKVAEHSTVKRVTKGSVVFPKRGAAIMTNKVRIMGIDSYMDTNMMALTSEKLDSEFLYNIISKEGLYKIADTSTIPQINNKHVEPYEVTIPSLAEQRRIGAYFKQLDHLITLHQRKCDEFRIIKKYMLQNMFV